MASEVMSGDCGRRDWRKYFRHNGYESHHGESVSRRPGPARNGFTMVGFIAVMSKILTPISSPTVAGHDFRRHTSHGSPSPRRLQRGAVPHSQQFLSPASGERQTGS